MQEPSHGLQALGRRRIEGTAKTAVLLRRQLKVLFFSDELTGGLERILKDKVGKSRLPQTGGPSNQRFLSRLIRTLIRLSRGSLPATRISRVHAQFPPALSQRTPSSAHRPVRTERFGYSSYFLVVKLMSGGNRHQLTNLGIAK